MKIDTDYYDRAEREEMLREERARQAAERRVCPECRVMGGHNYGCPAAPDGG